MPFLHWHEGHGHFKRFPQQYVAYGYHHPYNTYSVWEDKGKWFAMMFHVKSWRGIAIGPAKTAIGIRRMCEKFEREGLLPPRRK